jgi:RHS repeat-associated protein
VQRALPAITEYQYKRLSTVRSGYRDYPECRRTCRRFWKRERALDAGVPASQELWRELYLLGMRTQLFNGFDGYSYGISLPAAERIDPQTLGAQYPGPPQRVVGLQVPGGQAGTVAALRYPGLPIMASAGSADVGGAWSTVVPAPTMVWVANTWNEGLGWCESLASPDPGLPGPAFALQSESSFCVGIDAETHQRTETGGLTLHTYTSPLAFDGPPELVTGNTPSDPNTVSHISMDPGFELSVDRVTNELSNHSADYSQLISWLNVALGGAATFTPQAEQLYGGSNPGAENLVHTCAGDPVDCATGNFTETFADTTVAGPGVTLSQSRSYNSLEAAQPDATRGAFGYGWTATFRDRLEFDGDDVVVHHANGSQVRFTLDDEDGSYSPDEYVQSTLTRAGSTFKYVLPSQLTFTFGAGGRLLNETDANGNVTTLGYVNGKLDQVTDPVGRVLQFSYNADGTVATATDPMGHVVSYEYDGGELVSVTDVGGKVTHFAYDDEHRITSVTDPRAHTVTNAYDGQGRVVSQHDALGHETTWDYDGDETTITHPGGSVTHERFEDNLPVSVTRAAGTTYESTTLLAYDNNYNMVRKTDPNGHVWRSTYDLHGNRLKEIDPLDHTTTYKYDGKHHVTSMVEPGGLQTSYSYDPNGNLDSWVKTARESGQNQRRWYSYNARGQVTSSSAGEPTYRVWSYGYDPSGNLTSSTTPAGRSTTMSYDGNGLLLTSTTPRGKTTTLTRNAYGEITSSTDARGKASTTEYDAVGNATATVDRDGHRTETSFDELNRPTTLHRADGTTWTTSYTAAGQVASRADGRHASTDYIYDKVGRVRTVTDPLGRVTSYGYDDGGRVVSVADAGHHETTLAYDAADRLVSRDGDGANGDDATFDYDVDGNRTSMTDATGTTTYTYDSLGRLTRQVSGSGQATGYHYDQADRLTAIDYPDALGAVTVGSGGTPSHSTTGTVTRSYDVDDRLVSVTDWLANTTTFGYDDDDELTSVTRPNGVNAAYGYDDAGSLTSLADNAPALPLGRGDGRLLTSAGTAPSQVSFSYDAAQRLTVGDGRAYGYDDADNLTQTATVAGTAVQQHFDDANQLTSRSVAGTTTATYDYDLEGRRTTTTPTSGGASHFAWSTGGRLLSYSGPGATGTVDESYKYDGDGLRQSKTSDGQRTHQAYDLSGSLPLMLVDGPTAYVTGPGGLPIEQITSGGAVRSFHHDQLGSTTALTDATGTTVQSYTYDPYGQLTSGAPTIENPFRYAGQYTDDETGLQYLRARYYDPQTGQFLSRDPLESSTGQPYSYADDNPVNGTDPTGLNVLSAIADFESSFIPMSWSNAARTGLDVVTGGASEDIACNGFTLSNGVMLAMAFTPGGRVGRLGARAAEGVAGKVAGDVLATPRVGSGKLQNIVDNLYKGTTNPNRVGNGTTMDAIRAEAKTGAPTGGRWHTTKGQESLRGLSSWLRRNPDAPDHDRRVAQSLADELADALGGGR